MALALVAFVILITLPLVIYGVFVCLRALPEHTRGLIREFQTLLGGCIALTAALVAFCGVWFSVTAQDTNTQKQIDAARAQFNLDAEQRRDAQAKAINLERRQLAAAFASEISVIAQVFSGAGLLQSNTKSIEAIKQALVTHPALPISVTFNKPRADYAVIYRANASRIGLFPPLVAEEIVRFYGTYIQLDENLKTLDQAAKEHFEHMGLQNVEDALNAQDFDLKGLKLIKDDLVPRLKSLAAEPSSSNPTQDMGQKD
jgi:hypothetical protein